MLIVQWGHNQHRDIDMLRDVAWYGTDQSSTHQIEASRAHHYQISLFLISRIYETWIWIPDNVVPGTREAIFLAFFHELSFKKDSFLL